jgi:hypothetical protein
MIVEARTAGEPLIAKSRISRATGVPFTKSGRQRKVGRIVTGGGCLLPCLPGLLAAGVTAVLFI